MPEKFPPMHFQIYPNFSLHFTTTQSIHHSPSTLHLSP